MVEHVCSTILALACDDGFSQITGTDTNDGGVDMDLKNIEISCKVLKKQSVSYVMRLSWSLLCQDLKTSVVMVGREMISRYSITMLPRKHDSMDEGREYILGLLLVRSIHVVCEHRAEFEGEEAALLGEHIRHALMGPVYRLVHGG